MEEGRRYGHLDARALLAQLDHLESGAGCLPAGPRIESRRSADATKPAPECVRSAGSSVTGSAGR